MSDRAGNSRLFWTTALLVLALDAVTKYFAVKHLVLHTPREVVGDVVRFTLAYNQGAAFSMRLGSPAVSRVVFGTFALIALFVLWRIHRTSAPGDRLKVLAVALAWGGAAGNLVDRIRSTQGVVDFIDIGVNNVRFWTFNVADAAVSVGAVLLAIVLWREDMALKREAELAQRPSELEQLPAAVVAPNDSPEAIAAHGDTTGRVLADLPVDALNVVEALPDLLSPAPPASPPTDPLRRGADDDDARTGRRRNPAGENAAE